MKHTHTRGLGSFVGSRTLWQRQNGLRSAISGVGPIAQILLTIYATVEEPSLWTAALTALASAFGAATAKLLLNDSEGRQLTFTGQPQASPAVRDSLTDAPGAAAPWPGQTGLSRAWPAIPPLSGLRHVPPPRAGVRDIELPLSCGRLRALFGIYRDGRQEVFDAEECLQIHSLLPHLNLALDLRQRMAAQDERLQLIGSVCDHLDHVVVIVDRRCRVLHQTPRAAQFLAEAGVHAVPFEPLTLPDPADQAKLQRAMARPVEQAEIVFSGRNHRHINAGVLPLFVTGGGFGLLEGAVAIIMSQDIETPQIEHRQLMNRFHLTATEANLAVDLYHGKRVAEIAGARGVSLTTVRAQLRAVLAKTETHRQLDLVLLLSHIAARGELASFGHEEG